MTKLTLVLKLLIVDESGRRESGTSTGNRGGGTAEHARTFYLG